MTAILPAQIPRLRPQSAETNNNGPRTMMVARDGRAALRRGTRMAAAVGAVICSNASYAFSRERDQG